MSQFAEVACLAAEIATRAKCGPRDAWLRAAKQLNLKPSLQVKNCPRATFLVLCQEGLVSGVPTGNYVRAVENRKHTLDAIRHLKREPSLADDPLALWRLVAGDEGISHDSQMHVVTSLWKRGQLRKAEPAS